MLARMSTERKPRECCDDTDGRSNLSVLVGTTWRKVYEALDDLKESGPWE